MTKIKNGSVTLPKEVRESWRGADVFIRSSNDMIVIRRAQAAPFWKTWGKLKKNEKKISSKDIESAIRAARVQKIRAA